MQSSYIYTVDRSNVYFERTFLFDSIFQLSCSIKWLKSQVNIIIQCERKLPSTKVWVITTWMFSIWRTTIVKCYSGNMKWEIAYQGTAFTIPIRQPLEHINIREHLSCRQRRLSLRFQSINGFGDQMKFTGVWLNFFLRGSGIKEGKNLPQHSSITSILNF